MVTSPPREMSTSHKGKLLISLAAAGGFWALAAYTNLVDQLVDPLMEMPPIRENPQRHNGLSIAAGLSALSALAFLPLLKVLGNNGVPLVQNVAESLEGTSS